MNELDKAFWLAWGIAVAILVYQELTRKMHEIAQEEAMREVSLYDSGMLANYGGPDE